MTTQNLPQQNTVSIMEFVGRVLEVLIVIVAVVLSLHWFVSPLSEQLQHLISTRQQTAADAVDLYQRATLLHREGDHPGAIALLNYAIELSDRPTGAMYALRGQAAEHIGRVSMALQDYRQALTLTPGQPELYQRMCNLHLMRGEYVSAEQACSDGLQVAPNNFEMLNIRCYVRTYITDNHAGAIQDCNQALQQQPNHPYPYNNRAHAHLAQNNFGKALDDATQSINLGNPMPYMPYTTRGDVHLALSNPGAAYEDFRAALDASSDYVPALLGMARTYEQAGQPDAAQTFYCRYINASESPDMAVQQRVQQMGGCEDASGTVAGSAS